MSKPKVSERFMAAFTSGSGGCVRTCECGITHWDTSSGYDWDEGERENLDKKSDSDPMSYMAHDYCPSTYTVDGKEYVMGCPCESAAKYEQFIIRHDRQIAEYLNSRAKALEEKAAEIKVKDQP